jgi:hypothetical protein
LHYGAGIEQLLKEQKNWSELQTIRQDYEEDAWREGPY